MNQCESKRGSYPSTKPNKPKCSAFAYTVEQNENNMNLKKPFRIISKCQNSYIHIWFKPRLFEVFQSTKERSASQLSFAHSPYVSTMVLHQLNVGMESKCSREPENLYGLSFTFEQNIFFTYVQWCTKLLRFVCLQSTVLGQLLLASDSKRHPERKCLFFGSCSQFFIRFFFRLLCH